MQKLETDEQKTFFKKILSLLTNPPRKGAWDDLILTLIVFAFQFPFFFLYSLFYINTNVSWTRVLLDSIGFLILIDVVLFLFYWITRLTLKFLEQKLKTSLYFTASFSLLMAEFARLIIYVSNKIRKSELPSYFYVNEEPEKRTVLKIFVRGLYLSFLSVLIPFQVRAITSKNPVAITFSSSDTWLFIIWSLITTYFFVSWDLLNRSDLRYFDKDDATMKKLGSWYNPIIAFIIGVVIYWALTSFSFLFSTQYLLLGVMFWSFDFFLISLILINQETEIKNLLSWIREGYPKKNFRLN